MEQERKPIHTSQKGNSSDKMKDKVFLIAEDDEVSYILIETYLMEYKCKTYRAKNGKEAIEMIQNKPEIDIVLMDIKMPDTDGIEATKEIRKLNPLIPIIAQTAYVFSSDREKAMAAGCSDYIVKPINKEELLQKIEAQFKG